MNDRTAQWAEWGSDRLNPILVKEARQSLKSRQFLLTFSAMLLFAWLISAFSMITLQGEEFAPIGDSVFRSYYVVLAFAVLFVVPFGAFRSISAERDLNTWELLSITTLSPKRIVWGKLQSAVVQLFIFYSAISPFVTFTYSLRGIDLPTIGVVLVCSMFVSVFLSLAALTLSTFAAGRQAQALLSLVVLGGLLTALVAAISLVWNFVGETLPFDDANLWWNLAAAASYYIGCFLLCLQVATAQLTFESDNHASGIRLISSGLFWLTVCWLAAGLISRSPRSFPDLNGWLAVLGIGWSVLFLCAASERETLSRRIRLKLPGNILLRFLWLPLLPGSGRGFLFGAGHLFALCALAVWSLSGTPAEDSISFVLALSCYTIIYCGLACFMSRWLRPGGHQIKPALVRVLAVLLFAVGSVTPHLADMIRDSPAYRNPYYYVADPFWSLANIDASGPRSAEILIGLIIVAGLIVAGNTPAMFRGVAEVLFPRNGRDVAPGMLEFAEANPQQEKTTAGSVPS